MSLRRLEPALSSTVKRLMFRPSAGSGGGSNSSIAAPSAPTGLAAIGGPLQITYTWDAQPGVTFSLFIGHTPGGEDASPVASGLSGTGYVLSTNLAPGTTYYSYIRAVNSGGPSPPSNEVPATTDPLPPAPFLTADDGVTFLTADDGATFLLGA